MVVTDLGVELSARTKEGRTVPDGSREKDFVVCLLCLEGGDG